MSLFEIYMGGLVFISIRCYYINWCRIRCWDDVYMVFGMAILYPIIIPIELCQITWFKRWRRRNDFETLREIGSRIRTQDNRITSDPLFIIQQKRRIYGVDSDYTDLFIWVDDNDPENIADETKCKELDMMENFGEDTGDWVKVGYIEHWEFVTACFTEQGCKDYLAINGHNLNKSRIYVESAYRNHEYIAVREFLKELA